MIIFYGLILLLSVQNKNGFIYLFFSVPLVFFWANNANKRYSFKTDKLRGFINSSFDFNSNVLSKINFSKIARISTVSFAENQKNIEIANTLFYDNHFSRVFEGIPLITSCNFIYNSSDRIAWDYGGTIFDNSNYFNAFGYLKLDTYDDKVFPTKGYHADLNAKWYGASSGSNEEFTPFLQGKGTLGFATSFGDKLTFQVTNEAGFTLNKTPSDVFDFYLGGYNKNYINTFISFYGYDFAELIYQYSESDKNFSNRPSNWYQTTTIGVWQQPGIYNNRNLGPVPFSGITIVDTQHFEFGNENLEIDISTVINSIKVWENLRETNVMFSEIHDEIQKHINNRLNNTSEDDVEQHAETIANWSKFKRKYEWITN